MRDAFSLEDERQSHFVDPVVIRKRSPQSFITGESARLAFIFDWACEGLLGSTKVVFRHSDMVARDLMLT